MQAPPINQHQTQQVLGWLQSITLSRPPKNLTRDFSDGVLMAQVMHSQFPTFVHLHNYQPANSSTSKYINWKTLNEKIFKKIGIIIQRSDIESIISNTPGTIQKILYLIYSKIILQQNSNQSQSISIANKLTDLSNNLYTQQLQQKNSSKFNQLIEEQNKNGIFAKQYSAQLAKKQNLIKQLRDTIDILQVKMKKMEQLSKLKDVKIDSLMKKLDQSIGL